MSRIRVTITGAAGQIGYALLFRIASGQMFGPKQEVELQLLELEQALPALNGVAMELDDCAFPLLKKITCTSVLSEAFHQTNWALLVGSVPRKAGMERGDLLQINGGIFTSQGKAINDHASRDVKTFVVGNPCNTNCLVAMKNAPEIPNDQFFAMTMLDENRARTQLAKKANCAIEEVQNLTIWGNHSATQYPDFYNAQIQGRPALEIIQDENWAKTEFLQTVQQRGAQIIKARGSSSAASAANAVVDGVKCLTNQTPSGQTYSMAKASNGEYGVDKDLIFSFPCETLDGKVKVKEGIEHNSFGQEKFQTTLKELQEERDLVANKGLFP